MSVSVLTSPVSELTVVPVDRDRWPAAPGQYMPNDYIRVTLDLATGQLAILADPHYRGPAKESRELQKYRGSYTHHWDFPVPVPSHMTWTVTDMIHPTREQAEQLLELIAEQARVLLTELAPVDGRRAGGYDWTLRTAAAVRAIDSYTSNWWHAVSPTSSINADWTRNHEYQFRGLLDMPDALEAVPELASSEWAVMTDAELDDAAAKLARFTPWSQREKWIEAAHLDRNDRYATNTPIYLVGVLAALYRLRAERAGALTPCDATVWFAERPTRLTVVDDCTGDVELAALAQAEERAAAADGKRLLGALTYVTAVRTERRNRIRQALTRAGQHRDRHVLSTRAALLLRVDGWGDPQDGDEATRNAVLAQLAGISRETTLSLRERAHAVNTAVAGDQQVDLAAAAR